MEEVLRGVESSLSQVGWSVLISIVRNPDRPEAFRWLRKQAMESNARLADVSRQLIAVAGLITELIGGYAVPPIAR